MNIIGLQSYPCGLTNQTKKLIKVIDTLDIQHELCDFKSLKYNTNIISLNPHHVKYFSSYIHDMNNVGLWTWETCDFPKEYAEVSKYFRQIWVLSEWNKEIIEKSISSYNDCDVHVIKLPFECSDITTLSPNINDIMKLLFIYDGKSGKRKNVPLLVNSINNINSSSHICDLTLKSLNDTRDINHDNIRMIKTLYSEDDIERLYNDSDIYTSLHASEGFGFTIIDAMRLNTPVICTGFSGNMDYCNHDNAFLIDYDIIHSNETYFEGRIAKPNINHFEQTIHQIHNDTSLALKKSKIAYEDIKENYNINICSKILEKYIP